jgi:hypothetical protein
MIDRTEQRLGLKPQRLAADSAYGSAPTLNWIVNEKQIAPHIPVIDKSMREHSLAVGLHVRQGSQRLRLPDGQASKNDRTDSRRAQVSVYGEHPRLWLVSP